MKRRNFLKVMAFLMACLMMFAGPIYFIFFPGFNDGVEALSIASSFAAYCVIMVALWFD